MLRSLEIRDMLIIDRLELEFQPGLNVLTGETGAGKSILLDSLGFVLGWRGRAELVREGAEQGEVTACFDIPKDHHGWVVLSEAGWEFEDELILRRVTTKEGRKTAWINGRRAPAEILKGLSETLLEFHGQHDDRGLLNARGHRELLDSFAGVESELVACQGAWKAMSVARASLAKAEEGILAAKQVEEFLRHAVAEFDALHPAIGEEAELDSKRRLMQAAERIKADISSAAETLGLQGAEGQLSDAVRWLNGVSGETGGRLDASLEALEKSLSELDVAQQGVQRCLDELSFNPSELEEAEERLFAIRALARKHNVLADELPEFADSLRSRLEVIDNGSGQLNALRADLKDAEATYEKNALSLRDKRTRAAAVLDRGMSEELSPLKMERAVFQTELREAEPGPAGSDEVAFKVATNPGAPSGPLNKIASGGELSRFLLALKVCLSKGRAGGLTMIFDEIDRGVGGATAAAVGRRLSDLAEGGQVLVVTHSPQVAAVGQHHWRVEKRQEDSSTLSTVVPLDASSRIDEIARMLSGDIVTPEAKAAAKSLIVG